MRDAIHYNHETVPLDGEAFRGCEFRDCRMVFSGGESPRFENCTFVDCDWRLEDAAARTLAHMQAVWNAGGKASIQALIKEITTAGR